MSEFAARMSFNAWNRSGIPKRRGISHKSKISVQIAGKREQWVPGSLEQAGAVAQCRWYQLPWWMSS